MPTLPDNFEIPQWLFRRWIWHAAFWIVYFLSSGLEDIESGFSQLEDYWKLSIIAHLPTIISVYLVVFLGVPQLLYRKKYLFFGVFCIALALLMTIFGSTLWYFLNPHFVHKTLNSEDLKPTLLDGISISFLLVLFATSLKLGKDMLLESQRRADRAAQNLKSELSTLRQQISPHFLLNSLNTIYGLALTEPKNVAPTVILLSDLLRFSLYETRADRVSLARELDFLQDYVEMQRLRASEKLQMTFVFPQNLPTPPPQIAPLLLLVFIENSFKFAQPNSNGARFLKMTIHFDAERSTLLLACENSFLTTTPPTTGGLGLENVRRRLELIYPKKHMLRIHDEDGVWRVKLEIQLEK
jgi:sensor histidine kinase YesM